MIAIIKKPYRFLVADVLADIGNRRENVFEPGTPLEELTRWMVSQSAGENAFLVDDDEVLLGTVSLDGLLHHLVAQLPVFCENIYRSAPFVPMQTARDVMEPCPFWTTEDEPITDVLENLAEIDTNEVPVVDTTRRWIGSLTLLDLTEFLFENQLRR